MTTNRFNMRQSYLIVFFTIIFFSSNQAQDLPQSYRFSDDELRLIRGGVETQGFYNEQEIDTIYLEFDQSDYWQQLKDNYKSKTDIPATLIYKGETYDSVGVRFKGQTSYMQSNEYKKSFNITMDYVFEDQNIEGYETLNLNNAQGDPSFLREILFYNISRDHIPTSKANFVELYINGESWGLYPNIQQLNKEHVSEWYFDEDATRWRCEKEGGGGPGGGGGGNFGLGYCSLNYLGSDTSDYQPYYNLKKSYKKQPWDDLVRVCELLNNSSDDILIDSLSTCMDIDGALWFIAFENIFCDEDGYINKGGMDYYVYFDVKTNCLEPIEYDANSMFKERSLDSWTPFKNANDSDYALLYVLLNHDELRQRYLAHYRYILETYFDADEIAAKIDAYVEMIDNRVQNDEKKNHSYYEFLSEIQYLKDFFIERKNYLLSNSEVDRVVPEISDLVYRVDGVDFVSPDSSQSVVVNATVTADADIANVFLYYGKELSGSFNKIIMYDDGNHNDGAVADGVYGALIPPHQQAEYVRFYIEAVSNDNWNTVSYLPAGAEHDVYLYQVDVTVLENSDVVINELMADNEESVQDPDGEYDDWIELYNNSGESIDLSGWLMSDDIDELDEWAFPDGITIDGNGYLIVWCDEDLEQDGLHADFKLSAGGETVYLSTPDLEIAQEITFDEHGPDESYSRVPNGTGEFVWQTHTFNANNNSVSIVNYGDSKSGLKCYPVPASDWITVEMTDGETHTISIYSLMGNPVFNGKVSSSIRINVKDWPDGIYFVRNEQGTIGKLIVQ